MELTQSININDQIIQIRRLINPAKRIIISNLCPSMPNTTILDALKNIGINPTSKINHLKASINLKGYEHIMSFRRQMYINYEDTPKLPSSLLIDFNKNQFRIFFTDDILTCFICKSIGHTSINCKKNIENKSLNQSINNTNIINTSELRPELRDNIQSSLTPELNLTQKPQIMDWHSETDLPLPLFSNQILSHPPHIKTHIKDSFPIHHL